jgi:pilus assembly protein Flp/PilA
MPKRRTENDMSKISKLRATMAVLRARLAADERGATAIEYAIIAAGIGATIAATVFSFGSELKSTFYDKIASIL